MLPFSKIKFDRLNSRSARGLLQVLAIKFVLCGRSQSVERAKGYLRRSVAILPNRIMRDISDAEAKCNVEESHEWNARDPNGPEHIEGIVMGAAP